MARSEDQKCKLLYLRDYLCRNTDAGHPASVAALVDYLESKGIRAERKSIYDDIRVLNEYGVKILHQRKRPSGYYVEQRDFELSELKLLVDAVQSSRFLTERRSMELIRKLAALSSSHEEELLRRQVVVSGRLKNENDASLDNIDLLHEAIAKNSRVTFRYSDWGVDLKRHERPDLYETSPLALCWDDENYYLVAYGGAHGLTHYRVDKMSHITLTGEKREAVDAVRKFDPASYSKKVFGMFRGETKRVKLRFENALAGVVVDRFGRDVMLIAQDASHFTFTAEVSVSPMFLGWLAGFGGRASVVFPQSVVEEYRAFCQRALAALPEE